MESAGSTTSSFQDARNPRRWHFSGAVFDERSLELVVEGVVVDVERKPVEVLRYLLQRSGEVCTKDELLDEVWQGRVLSETVLTKCIGRLREALRDTDQSIIKTAYGFGYRLVAAVRVEDYPDPLVAPLQFGPGDHPPGRPLWSFVERLGAGGHGEAWRAKHDKTNEQRVFKIARDEASLGALKREITLFRVINDSLGGAARVVRLLDWNLEQRPYFIETQFIAGGSLVDWAKVRGGIAVVPMAERLELVASVASALASVHAVGVLHKDLKPSNVLIQPREGGLSAEPLLADFGSGTVADADRLERLGITRLGFTRTVARSSLDSVTPLYLAPEVIAGQPFTVKSDIYALGVMLYQIIVGDLHRVMSAGWERDVPDELLREDIALAAEGNAAIRLADAEVLSRRLRDLDGRRKQRDAERLALQEAEDARRTLERVRARRAGLLVAFVALAAGAVLSTVLFIEARRSQLAAESAAAQAAAVIEYLGNDVFSPVSSGKESAKDLTVTNLLARAGDDVDTRLKDQPRLASQLHFIIGRSLYTVYETALAHRHFQRSLELGISQSGMASESALRSAAELVKIDYLVGRLEGTIADYEKALTAGEARLAKDSAAVLELRAALARGHYLLGAWTQAAQEFVRLLPDIQSSSSASPQLLGEIQFDYGQTLLDLGQPLAAQRQLHAAIETLTNAVGEKHMLVSDAHSLLGLAFANAGDYDAATSELQTAQNLANEFAPPNTWTTLRPGWYRALVALELNQPQEAEAPLAAIVRYEDDNEASYLQSHQGLDVELDHTGAVRHALGEVYEREGRISEAISTLQKAVAVSELSEGRGHPMVASIRLSLADSLLVSGAVDLAKSAVAAVPKATLEHIPANHPIMAQWHRVNGLLEAHARHAPQARAALTQSLRIYQSLYGQRDWRVLRGQRELKQVSDGRTDGT